MIQEVILNAHKLLGPINYPRLGLQLITSYHPFPAYVERDGVRDQLSIGFLATDYKPSVANFRKIRSDIQVILNSTAHSGWLRIVLPTINVHNTSTTHTPTYTKVWQIKFHFSVPCFADTDNLRHDFPKIISENREEVMLEDIYHDMQNSLPRVETQILKDITGIPAYVLTENSGDVVSTNFNAYSYSNADGNEQLVQSDIAYLLMKMCNPYRLRQREIQLLTLVKQVNKEITTFQRWQIIFNHDILDSDPALEGVITRLTSTRVSDTIHKHVKLGEKQQQQRFTTQCRVVLKEKPQATGTEDTSSILQSTRQLPVDSITLPIEPQHVGPAALKMSLWECDMKELAHRPLETLDSPLAVAVGKPAHTLIDTISLGEMSAMTRPMRIWAKVNSETCATQVVSYIFVTASTIVNQLIIGLAVEKKATYRIDELQIIEWKAMSPQSFTATIELNLAAVNNDRNIPNRYTFVETHPLGTRVPTIVLMTATQIENSYQNDAVSINIRKQMHFANQTKSSSAFRATAEDLNAGDPPGFDSGNSITGISMSNLLNIPGSIPAFITCDGGYVTRKFDDDIPLTRQLQIQDGMQYYGYNTGIKYPGRKTIVVDQKFSFENNNVDAGRDGEWAWNINSLAGKRSIVLPCKISDENKQHVQNTMTTMDTDTTSIYKLQSSMSDLLYEDCMLLTSLDGLPIPAPNYTNKNIYDEFNGSPLNLTFEQGKNLWYDRLKTSWRLGGWDYSIASIIGGTEYEGIRTGTCESECFGGHIDDELFVDFVRWFRVNNMAGKAVYMTNSLTMEDFNVSTSKRSVIPYEMITLSHPLYGNRTILVLRVAMKTLGGQPTTGTNPHWFDGHFSLQHGKGDFPPAFVDEIITGEFTMNLVFLLPIDKDYGEMITRVYDSSASNVVTLNPTFTNLNFVYKLPMTIPATLSESQISMERSDLTFKTAWRNYVRVNLIPETDTTDMVQFQISNKINISPIANVYYVPSTDSFFVLNNPIKDSDRYPTYPKLNMEEVIISGVRRLPISAGPTATTNTVRWIQRVVPDVSKLNFNGNYLSTTILKEKARVEVTIPAQAEELAMLAAGGGGGLFDGISKALMAIFNMRQQNSMQQAMFDNIMKQLQQKFENDKQLKQMDQDFRLQMNGMSSPIAQSSRAGLGYPQSSPPIDTDTSAQSWNRSSAIPDLPSTSATTFTPAGARVPEIIPPTIPSTPNTASYDNSTTPGVNAPEDSSPGTTALVKTLSPRTNVMNTFSTDHSQNAWETNDALMPNSINKTVIPNKQQPTNTGLDPLSVAKPLNTNLRTYQPKIVTTRSAEQTGSADALNSVHRIPWISGQTSQRMDNNPIFMSSMRRHMIRTT